MPKLKTKSYLKKRASMTATGKIRVARNAHKNDNMVGQAKILAPYGLK